MIMHDHRRRALVATLAAVPLGAMLRASPVVAQIVQPAEKTKAGFLARARALRDQAVREGDQAYGAVVVRNGIIVGEGRNYVVLESDPTAHAELLAVRDAARRLKTRDLSDCEVFSTATPCPMCQGALYWGPASAAITTRARQTMAWLRNSHANGDGQCAIFTR